MTFADSFLRSGKVRDLFDLDGSRLLIVASDRISAFDVVLPTPIPDKGRVLTGLSRFWFETTRSIVPNHLLSIDPSDLPEDHRLAGGGQGRDASIPLDGNPVDGFDLKGRMMICRTARVLPVEVIVRGYLAGTGWKDYQRTGEISGVRLPPGLVEAEQLAEPIFTPSTKAESGLHDENITFDQMVEEIGGGLAERVRQAALSLYRAAAGRTEAAGILLADTKFEFGLAAPSDPAGHEPGRVQEDELLLIDEVLTPDSSRFWDRSSFRPGGPQPSFDKQFVRDYLEGVGWDKRPPGPELPADIVAGTRQRYVAAFERITCGSYGRYRLEDRIAA